MCKTILSSISTSDIIRELNNKFLLDWKNPMIDC